MNDRAGEAVTDTRAWRGVELARTDWITHLSGDQINALYTLADTLPMEDSDWFDVDPRAQADPVINELLNGASEELSSGKGFVLFRGLDASNTERLRRVFWILGNGLGVPVMQNAKGELLSIVVDRFAGAERGVVNRHGDKPW